MSYTRPEAALRDHPVATRGRGRQRPTNRRFLRL